MVVAIARCVFVRVAVRWIVKSGVVMLVLKEPTRSFQTRVKKARSPSEGHQRKDENAGAGKHDGAQWYATRPNTQLYFTRKPSPLVGSFRAGRIVYVFNPEDEASDVDRGVEGSGAFGGGLAWSRLRLNKFVAGAFYLREGGSVGLISDPKAELGVDAIMLGLFLPESNLHAPNESFDLGIMQKGIASIKTALRNMACGQACSLAQLELHLMCL